MAIRSSIVTVGCTGATPSRLLAQLRASGITAVADVRHHPLKATHPEWSPEAVASMLSDYGISYVPVPELDPAMYMTLAGLQAEEEGGNDIMSAPQFLAGMRRLERGSDLGYRLALLGDDRDPAVCHRGLIVGHALWESGWRVLHFSARGRTEPHETLLERIMAMRGIKAGYLPQDYEERMTEAWRWQCERYIPGRQAVTA